MGSPEGQPQNNFNEGGSSKILPDINDYITNRIQESDGFLLQSRGILDRVAKEAYESGMSSDKNEDEIINATREAIDLKIDELEQRSTNRFKSSGISDSDREELYIKNPRRSSTRFKDLRH